MQNRAPPGAEEQAQGSVQGLVRDRCGSRSSRVPRSRSALGMLLPGVGPAVAALGVQHPRGIESGALGGHSA